MISVEEARARIFKSVRLLEAETLPLDACAGRVLAEPLRALRTQPPFHASAMDGYAVRAGDVTEGRTLRIIGTSQAGNRHHGNVGAAEAVRILTGAPVPDGADAVIIQENVSVSGSILTARSTIQPGDNIRPAGIDFSSDNQYLGTDRPLSPRDLALAAGLGHSHCAVRRRPRIALLSTGDELVAPGGHPNSDQIIATSGLALSALIKLNGGDVLDLGIVPDDRHALQQALEEAIRLKADVLVTLGGASVGDHDHVHELLHKAGLRNGFWKVAMKPGKPIIFGEIGAMSVFGMPGNPVSAYVCAVLFLMPYLYALQGRAAAGPDFRPAVLACDMPSNGPREHYVRAELMHDDTTAKVRPLADQDSSLTRVLADASALILRPALAPAARTGDMCQIIELNRFM